MNYLLLGAAFLTIGAQASTAREVQTMSMPVTFAQVLIFGFAVDGDRRARIRPKALAAAVFPLVLADGDARARRRAAGHLAAPRRDRCGRRCGSR